VKLPLHSAMAVDPTYPLFPVLCLICPALILLVFVASVVRQPMNIALWILCFTLFFETLTYGVDHVLWADNVDIKNIWLCDAVSHFRVFGCVSKPACSFVITRRLYKIATLRPVTADAGRKQKRIDLSIELGVAVALPILIMAVVYTLVQSARFKITEGFGCEFSISADVVTFVVVILWPIILPLVSIIFFCPTIFIVFYRHGSLVRELRESNEDKATASRYVRILALGGLDIFLTLPFGTLNLVQVVRSTIINGGTFPFYIGRATASHIVTAPYASIQRSGTLVLFLTYFTDWSSVIFAFAIFMLFGLTSEARATYSKWACTVGVDKCVRLLPRVIREGRWFAAAARPTVPQMSTIRFGTLVPRDGSSTGDEQSCSGDDRVKDAGLVGDGLETVTEVTLESV